jgi:hypothetical protein
LRTPRCKSLPSPSVCPRCGRVERDPGRVYGTNVAGVIFADPGAGESVRTCASWEAGLAVQLVDGTGWADDEGESRFADGVHARRPA